MKTTKPGEHARPYRAQDGLTYIDVETESLPIELQFGSCMKSFFRENIVKIIILAAIVPLVVYAVSKAIGDRAEKANASKTNVIRGIAR